MDSVLRKLFSGDLDFRKTETNLFFVFCPRGGGVWGGIRAGFLNFLARRGYLFTNARVLGPKYPVPFLRPFGVRISEA